MAGSAGVEAATNIVVHDANRRMLLYVYGAVILLCTITFRNWRAAVVLAVLSLMLTSVLEEALMVALGIGVAWAWSHIKFQADMGILLTFMFLWNMVGALVMIPALSHFLLRKV